MKTQAKFTHDGRRARHAWLSAVSVFALAACQNAPKTGDAKTDSVSSAMSTAGAATNPPGCKQLGGNSNTQNAVIGAAGGAVLGALIGGAAAKKPSVGARNGALIGALGGALAGSQYNKMIGMTEQPDGSVKLNIPGSVMFRSGSADISPEFGATLTSMGNTVREYCGLTATVVGHTDNVGGPEQNQRLSNERANAVVAYLVRQGLQANQLRAEGHGMNEPIASNASDAGRAQNRRVEIFVKPGASSM
jgi:outer membrane protein OmpA-like peptidoglycan-associated protein